MNLIELDRALKQLRLAEWPPCWRPVCVSPSRTARPIDLLSCLVSDELALRGERLLERRTKQAQFATRTRLSITSTSLSTRR